MGGSTASKIGQGVVVFLVVGVLGLIFWPIHSGGYPVAERTLCLSNVKQLGIGQLIYVADYDDRFPNRDNWMDASLPYIKREETFHDPIFKKTPALYGYCFNAQLSLAKTPATGTAEIPLIFDSTNQARNASGSLASLPSPGRHKNRNSDSSFNNIGYADSHVKWRQTP